MVNYELALLEHGVQVLASSESKKYLGEILVYMSPRKRFFLQDLIKNIEECLSRGPCFEDFAKKVMSLSKVYGVVCSTRHNFDTE